MRNMLLIAVAASASMGSVAAPLPTASCKVAEELSATQVGVLSGAGALVWATTATAGSRSVAISRDGQKLAFVAKEKATTVTIADSIGKVMTFTPPPGISGAKIDEVRWSAANALQVTWRGKDESVHQFMNLNGWPTEPTLVADGDAVVGIACDKPLEGGRPVCTSTNTFWSDDSVLASFNHEDASIQPRVSLSQVAMPLGTSVAVPGATGASVRYLEFVDAQANVEVTDSFGTSTMRMSVGDEFAYNAPDSAHFFIAKQVQPSTITLALVKAQNGAYGFGKLAGVASGVMFAEVSGGPPGLLEVWQKSGNQYVRRVRATLPRAQGVTRMWPTQADVLAVTDTSGTYEAPFTLTYASGVVTGLTFGSPVTRPDTVAGRKVADWNCF